MMTIEIESDVLVRVKYAIGLVLCSTYHILTDDSLHSADKANKKAVLWQGNRTMPL